ncbi:ABC transporter substrate-binding protein [Brevibacillus brevis]|uniref:ABC transporter substrate-binding protein n=1 Tax=Brevibacillus brevis TaxID=1393 RepID=UPI000D110843|nr:ABC transporter substrate-binding protein [Brevibacillus brevis]PSJ67998.1 ABC transporter [Brevibacillus brevis]RED35466.1 iron complex transport system substrate-binding protein [Brevibacillus brevis]GEC87868.1 ferrichrome ABC transporter [Brevibacillus brevis]VEF89423.1 Iron(III)-hydroxamate-binding protein yxeB [Brevibacillus brevis]
MQRLGSIFMVLAIILVLMITGCGGGSGQQTTALTTNKQAGHQGSTPAKSESAFPRTIAHLSGETVIQEKPIKIATPYIAFVDYLAVLDEYPIAAQGVSTITANFPSLNKRVADKNIIDLGMEVDLEKLLAVQSDIIIAADDMRDQYGKLSQIAPTVILPQAGDWRETLQQMASIIGKEEKATNVLAEFDRKSAAYKEQLAFRSQESVMFVMYRGKEQFITWTDGRFDPFYNGLGLKRTEGAHENGQLSLEGLAQLNPDHLFVINNWQAPIQGGVKEALKGSNVWNSLNAVKNNRVYELADPSLPGPMALAKIDGIEEIMKAMGK